SSESRPSSTTVVTSWSASSRLRIVSIPIPFDAPVTNAVLLIFTLVFLQEVGREPHVYGSCHLEVLTGAIDEVHGLAGNCHQGRVLGEDLATGEGMLVSLLQMCLVVHMREMHVVLAVQ